MRQVARSALLALGYTVHEAVSADEALAQLGAGLRPRALFTDVVMPGAVSARELAARARVLIPGLAVLFTSGYTRDGMLRQGGVEPGATMLSKPWRSQELGRALHQVLHAMPTPSTGARRILLVDDEDLVRSVTADTLADLGFDVVEAENATSALTRLDTPPDLLITDLGLPDMQGTDLIRRAREALPGLPAILITGQTERPEGDFTFLPKPFDGAELRRAIGAAAPRASARRVQPMVSTPPM